MAEKVTHWLKSLHQDLAPVSESPVLDSQVLLAHVLGRPRAWVLAHPGAMLTTEQEVLLRDALQHLKNGLPLPYVLGRWEFYGLDFIVTPDTLIPRPETELLVENALDWLRGQPERRMAADVGTGSGCIAIALAYNIPDLHMLAVDGSYRALKVAAENTALHAVTDRVSLVNCDLLTPVRKQLDLICANLPYIPRVDLEGLTVARYEPLDALDGGSDGLDLIRRLINAVPRLLSPHGLLLLEIAAGQGRAASQIAKSILPGIDIQLLKDLAGRDRLLRVWFRDG